jgi:hypothetical protein
METCLVGKSMLNLSTSRALVTYGYTEIFTGWMKRFVNTLNLFAFPLNKEEHSL